MAEGDKVLCVGCGIDTGKGQGETGVIIGFGRFSKYHLPEALVRLGNGQSDYFWIEDLESAS